MKHNDFIIRIFQPCVPHYRVGLFRGVAKRYPARVEIISAARGLNGLESLLIDGAKCDYAHEEKKIGPVVLMKGATLRGLKKGDVIVIEGNVRKLSFLWMAMCAKLKGIGVVWWGLHEMPDQKPLNQKLRTWLMKRLATSVLFYNKGGVEWLRKGDREVKNVFAVGNAIDQGPIKQELAYWTAERISAFQEKNGIADKQVILASSRLCEKVRLDEAIRAMAEKGIPDDAVLVVIGDGPLRGTLEEVVEKCGVQGKVIWLGAMFDQHEMAPWFLSAKVWVYPGSVGLGVLHAMAYGLPAILNDTHNSTEAEAFENGKSGLMFKEFDVKDLARTIRTLLANAETRRRMGVYARRHVFENYTMDMMVDNWCEAVEAAR